jgi:hypothetical protein
VNDGKRVLIVGNHDEGIARRLAASLSTDVVFIDDKQDVAALNRVLATLDGPKPEPHTFELSTDKEPTETLINLFPPDRPRRSSWLEGVLGMASIAAMIGAGSHHGIRSYDPVRPGKTHADYEREARHSRERLEAARAKRHRKMLKATSGPQLPIPTPAIYPE